MNSTVRLAMAREATPTGYREDNALTGVLWSGLYSFRR